MARKEELGDIYRILKSDGSRKVVVLHGLGRIGKTQFNIVYIKLHKDNYLAIFWLNIKDEDSLKYGFATIIKQIL